jgi:hypothetical protein
MAGQRQVSLVDSEYLIKHYGGLSDAALMAVDRGELVEAARTLYDQEIARRGLRKEEEIPPVICQEPARPVNPRLRDVKRAALLASIATVAGVAIPVWNFARLIPTAELSIGKLATIAMTLVVGVFTGIVPFFYLALFLNNGDLSIPRTMRRMAITATALIGVLELAAIPRWIVSFRGESVLDSAARPWMPGDMVNVLGLIADLASILLLVTLFRLPDDRSCEGSADVSKLLRFTANVAAVCGVIAAVACLVGIAATPWAYSEIRRITSQMGVWKAQWAFSWLLLDRTVAALRVLCVFVAPWVVWRGIRARDRSAQAPEADQNA